MTDIETYFKQVETRQYWARFHRERPDLSYEFKTADWTGEKVRKKITSSPDSEVQAVYEEAKRIQEETGIAHEVDHIFPLSKGGAHCVDNLRIITATDNRRKGASTEKEFVFLVQGEDGRWFPLSDR